MKILRPDHLPRFWWINPWTTALELHRIINALVEWGDLADHQLSIDSRVIQDQSAEIRKLRERVADLYDDILAGRACNPDAKPIETEATK